jgi:nitroreductase
MARPRTAKGPASLALPRPDLSDGSLREALLRRRTVRAIRDRKLPRQVLSNLLWAARGVNRTDGPFGGLGLTTASASNSQEVDVLVATESGVLLFEPRPHRLVPVLDRDVRALAIGPGQRPLLGDAPVQLLFVADLHRLTHTTGFDEPGLHDPEVQKSYYFVDTGIIAQNVYLFCAAEGLAAWFHHCDRAALSAVLPLRREQRVLFAQTVGYPAAAPPSPGAKSRRR